MAANLSRSQFESGMIEETVADALKSSGLALHRFELEITKSLPLNNAEEVMAMLKGLEGMGEAIVMDDFGTGYSSLGDLWKFPFDKIKIDRIRVAVDGVAMPQQVEFLYDAKADQMQGFYFGKPVPASEIGADVLKDFKRVLANGEPMQAKFRVVKGASQS